MPKIFVRPRCAMRNRLRSWQSPPKRLSFRRLVGRKKIQSSAILCRTGLSRGRLHWTSTAGHADVSTRSVTPRATPFVSAPKLLGSYPATPTSSRGSGQMLCAPHSPSATGSGKEEPRQEHEGRTHRATFHRQPFRRCASCPSLCRTADARWWERTGSRVNQIQCIRKVCGCLAG